MPEEKCVIHLPLPYSGDALEPAVSAGALATHHGEVLRAHTDALHILLDGFPALAAKTPMDLLTRSPLPHSIRRDVQWHGAAILCHRLFFASLTHGNGGYPLPSENFLNRLRRDIGSYDGFCFALRTAERALYGNGFVWLLSRRRDGRLSIVQTENYTLPDLRRQIPLLCLDFWEHAYYPDYSCDRDRALNAYLSLLAWETIENRETENQ